MAAAVALSLPVVVSASIIATDDFTGYTNGPLGGQVGVFNGGWASSWVAAPAFSVAANVTNTSLSFTPSGGLTVGGGNSLSIAGTGTGIVVSRQLYAPQANTFYAGMLVAWDINGGTSALNSGNSLALFLTDSGTNVANGFNFGLYGIWSTYGTSLRVGTNTPAAGAYKALTTQYGTNYIVVKVEKAGFGNYNKITGWVNPTCNSEATNSAGDFQLLADSGVSNVTTLVFRAGGFNTTPPNGPDFTRVDAVTVATTFADLMQPADSIRPFIWVRDTEQSGILAKIATNAWASSLYNQLVTREAADLASYQANRDSYLRGLPVNWSSSPATFQTQTSGNGGPAQTAETIWNNALDCAILYYLTGNTNYARLAADVLHN